MKNSEAALWFKTNFQKQIETALEGTPFSVDLITAIALQETGYLWRRMIDAKKLSVAEILECCVGDTIDAKPQGGRSAFPKNKAELLAVDKGQEMFGIARAALVAVAPYDTAYEAQLKTASKFCRGFGIFQYDLQAFLDSPAERDYFLNKRWADFDACLAKAMMELKSKLRQLYGADKTSLTDTEQVYVAIVYNMGMKNFKFSKGFKQGHDSDGRYYGENIFDFMRESQAVSVGAAKPSTPPPGQAPLPPPTPIVVTGDLFTVDVQSVLLLHTDARLVSTNVNARLPNGQIVHRLSGKKGDKIWEIETSFNGANFRGFVSPDYLIPATKAKEVPVLPVVVVPAPAPGGSAKPAGGDIPAVSMPRKDGSVTKRKDRAGALSLNEPAQPGRIGETGAERCKELAAIIEWLAVDKSTNLRYQPTSTATYCNIYAHDYCFLAGVYLPRVWWLPGAIEKLAKGEKVEPIYEKTIDELRANDLFRWLRDFGARFGWRETSTLTKLQEAANLGGIGIIVARRKEDGRSGHIVVVAPEIAGQTARRNTEGEVIAPLQSQAGSSNFQYSTGKLNWWKDDRFAASAYYVHA